MLHYVTVYLPNLIESWQLPRLPGVVPISRVTIRDQDQLDSYPVGEDLCYKWAAEATRGGEGLPTAVQVVGRRFQDETVLYCMKQIEKMAKYKNV